MNRWNISLDGEISKGHTWLTPEQIVSVINIILTNKPLIKIEIIPADINRNKGNW